jgi:hypothetical protein
MHMHKDILEAKDAQVTIDECHRHEILTLTFEDPDSIRTINFDLKGAKSFSVDLKNHIFHMERRGKNLKKQYGDLKKPKEQT